MPSNEVVVKSKRKSKTSWTNLIVAVTAMIFPPVAEWITANPIMMMNIFAGLNMGLRLITKDKVVLW